MLKLQLCQSGVPYDRHLMVNKLCSVISYLLKRLNHDNIRFWFVLFDIAVSSIRIPRGCLDPVAWKRPAEYHLRIMLCSNAMLKKLHRIKTIPEKEKKSLKSSISEPLRRLHWLGLPRLNRSKQKSMGCNLLNKTEETKAAQCFCMGGFCQLLFKLWDTVLRCTETFSFLFFHLTHVFSTQSHTLMYMPYPILSHVKVSRYWTHHNNEGDGSNETPDEVIVHPEPTSAKTTYSE